MQRTWKTGFAVLALAVATAIVGACAASGDLPAESGGRNASEKPSGPGVESSDPTV